MLYGQSSETNKQMVIAAEEGDSAKVARLLEQGAEVNTRTPDGTTALMYAAQKGHEGIVKLLLEKDADPNLQPRRGVTALHASAISGYTEIARLLLNAGADPDLKDLWGISPLHYAAALNQPRMTEYMLLAGADRFSSTPEGYTITHLAATTGNPVLAEVVLHYGAPAAQFDDRGFLPLHITAQYGYKAFLKQLLLYGVKAGALTKDGLSAPDVAAANGHADYVAYFADSLRLPENKQKAWNALTLGSHFQGNKEVTNALEEHGQRRILQPWPAAVLVTYYTDWNLGDFFNGFALGIHDVKWNFDLSGGFHWRPYDKAVFSRKNADEVWQFREKRYVGSLWLDKLIRLDTDDVFTYGIFVRGGGFFSWGQYAGTTRRPGNRFAGLGGAGYYMKSRYFSLKTGYLYEDFAMDNTAPHRILLSFTGRILFRELRLKSIPKWLR